jgi:hypothetical protein
MAMSGARLPISIALQAIRHGLKVNEARAVPPGAAGC